MISNQLCKLIVDHTIDHFVKCQSATNRP